MSKLCALREDCALEPLPRQLLGKLKPSMVALRLLPAGEGTSNCFGSTFSNRAVGRKSEAPSEVLDELEVML